MSSYFTNKVFDKFTNSGYFDLLKQLRDEDIEKLFTNKINVNTDNYVPRGQDFNKKYNIIFSGCSETQGDFISNDEVNRDNGKNIWGIKVAKELDLSFINLALGGSSCSSIVTSIINYISKNGNPEIIMCLFPDPFRLTMPTDGQIMVSSNPVPSSDIVNQIFLGEVSEYPSFSKKPHVSEQVIPPIVPMWSNMQSILFLEQYCKSSNIRLAYSTWSYTTEYLIESVRSRYKEINNDQIFTGFFSTFSAEWNLNENDIPWNKDTCHGEIFQENPDLFDKGSDNKHIGVHQHQHVADIFLDRIQENKWYN